MKPTIFVDLDGMAANLVKKLVRLYNEEHGTNVTMETLWEHFKADGTDALNDYLDRPNVFPDIEPIEGFAEALPELQDMGNVIIVSAPSRHPDSATAKTVWVLERYPIHRKNIFLVPQKHYLRGDVWLEDWGNNIERIRGTNPTAFIGTIAYPYNEHVTHLLDARVGSIHDSANAWRELVSGVRTFISSSRR